MSENVSIVTSVYAAFNQGDIETALGLLADDVVWHERDSVDAFIVGGTHHGRQGVLAGVFAKVPEYFQAFRVEVEQMHNAGDTVIAESRYVATTRDGGDFDVAVAHVWTLRDGRVIGHASYPDTARYVAALEAVAA
jgi:ketosteroid isomerase-like protein